MVGALCVIEGDRHQIETEQELPRGGKEGGEWRTEKQAQQPVYVFNTEMKQVHTDGVKN